MVELREDELVFSFPQVHKNARLKICFQRTLRIPDDGSNHYLPPGLGNFPLRHIDDFAQKVPANWMPRGGVMLPMYQSEAMWLYFNDEYIADRNTSYPFAVKIASGKIDAITGQKWSNKLHKRQQNYLVSPEQPWLDGFCVEKGIIRQFVAMPLGSGYSVEEQVTGKAETGGLQIVAYPMKSKVFERRFPKVENRMFSSRDVCCAMAQESSMGLGMGGRMKQEIYKDPFDFADWDTEHSSRCFIHIANSLVWRAITGENPPTVPPTSKEYTEYGLPWFDFYSDAEALAGSKKLSGLKSVAELAKAKRQNVLPENESVTPENVITLRKGLKKNQVREGVF
jgi:hypothetical protein